MNFETLKDQLRDQWTELKGKIQENSTYQTLKERFEALSLNAQRAILVAVILLSTLFVLSFPYSYISSSNESLASFEDNRSLIRDLLQAARTINETPPLPPGLDFDSLKGQISSILEEKRLLPEQISDVTPITDRPAGNIAPPVVQQAGIAVSLKKLNLSQIVDLGHRFQSLNEGTKVMSLDIVRTAGQSHYYDAIYKVVNFSIPNLTAESTRPAGGKPNIRKRPVKKEEPPDLEDEE